MCLICVTRVKRILRLKFSHTTTFVRETYRHILLYIYLITFVAVKLVVIRLISSNVPNMLTDPESL